MHPIIILRYATFIIALIAFIAVIVYNKYFWKTNISLISEEWKRQAKVSRFLRGIMWISSTIWILTFVIKFFMDINPENVHVVFMI